LFLRIFFPPIQRFSLRLIRFFPTAAEKDALAENNFRSDIAPLRSRDAKELGALGYAIRKGLAVITLSSFAGSVLATLRNGNMTM
jgi:hypothetical protein